MAATAAPSQTLMSVPRVRFFAASIFIVSSYIYLLSRIVSGTEFSALYRTAMFASIFIELLTLRMSVPIFSMTPEVMNVIATSPILPFLALNIFLWLNSSAFMVQMASMSIVYTFLVIEYVPSDPYVSRNPYWIAYGRKFSDTLIPRKPLLLNLAAHLELLNLVLVIVSIMRLNGNLIHLMVFTQYIIAQYLTAPITKQAILFWDTIISRFLNDPRCPPWLKSAELKAREYLAKAVSFTGQYIKPTQVPSQSSSKQHK